MFQINKRKSKVRYDRIILFIVIPVVFTIAIIFIIRDNSAKNINTDNTIEEFVPVVYLSPSNQTYNDFADGNISEAGAMRAVSDVVEEYLKNNGVTVYVFDNRVTLREKVEFSNKNKPTVHVAIHSNTGNGIKNMGGTTCYYNSNVTGSRELSEFIYSRVSCLTPTDDHGVSDGTKGATYMYEVAETRAPSCMVEVEYHDSIKNARWIIENTDAIGKSIAEGIMQYIELAEKRHYEVYTENSEAADGEQDQLSEGT